jgi:hypothetical protein
VGNWLYGVAYRTALKARAATAKRRAKEKRVIAMPRQAADEVDLWHDLQPLLDQELNGLPDKYRVPIVLCDLEGKPRKEAARQLGWPEGTLSGRLARARQMLARRLARHGVALSAGSLSVVLAQNAAAACVPGTLLASTVNAVMLSAAGGVAAGVISAKVIALTEGVLKAMLLTKLKIATAVMLAVGVTGAGAGGVAYRMQVALASGAGQEELPNGQEQRPRQEGRAALLKELGQNTLEMQRLLIGLEKPQKRHPLAKAVDDYHKKWEQARQSWREVLREWETARAGSWYDLDRYDSRMERLRKEALSRLLELSEERQRMQLAQDLVKLFEEQRRIMALYEVEIAATYLRREIGTDPSQQQALDEFERAWQKLKQQLLKKPQATPTADPKRGEKPPEKDGVQGVVAEVSAEGLVMISLGSDDGIQRGQTLEVYRLEPNPEYVGAIRIIELQPRRAVGRPVNPGSAKQIKPNDKVASKIAPGR